MTLEKQSLPVDPSIPGLAARTVPLLKDQIEAGSDAFTIVCGVSFTSFNEYEDSRDSCNDEYDLAPYIRSLLLRELHGWGWTALHNFLSEDKHAQTIGYDPTKFASGKTAPSRTSISRAWNTYFGDSLKNSIETLGEWIRDYARATDNLIGDLMVEPEDRTGESQRTQYRIKRELAHETVEKFRDLFYDKLELKMPDDAQYSEADLYDFFLHIALTGDFANDGAETWELNVDNESTAPSGDTFRRYIRMFDELEENEVTDLFDGIDDLLWEIADRRGFTDGSTDAAIDEHAWLFYGDSDTPRITDVDPKRGTDKAYEFLTLSLISDDNEKFHIGGRLVSSRQEKLEAVKDLIEEADERVNLRDVMLDRGFYGTLFAQALKETNANSVVRGQLGSKSKKMWENTDTGVNVERVTMSRSYAPYESTEITRFVVPARDDADAEYMSFITNRELTEKQARSIGEAYKFRWGAETGYRVIDMFLPKTTSTDVALRVWYYRMAMLLYNVWVLVNGVVSEALELDADAPPPMTAKYLLTVLVNKHRDQGIT